MFGLGMGEVMLVAIALLIFVGPEQIPHLMRDLGRMYARMRRAANELRRAMMLEADRLDEEDRLRDLKRRREEAEAQRKKAETELQGKAQPGAHEAPVEAPAPAPAAASGVPPHFTAEEWAELPPHIREIIEKNHQDVATDVDPTGGQS